MAVIELAGDSGEPQRYEFDEREVVVGRHPGCDVVLPDTTVSRRHARIFQKSGEYYIEDLGSQHGTLVNDEPIASRQQLHNQDQIRVRTTVLTFFETDPNTSAHVVSDSDHDRPSKIISSRSGLVTQEKLDDGNAALKLRALLDITRELGASLDLKEVFPKILDSVFRIFPQASCGYILLAKGPKKRLVPYATKQTGLSRDDTTPISFTIARRVISRGEAILSADAADDERFKKSESVYRLGFRSVMCAPLMGSSEEPLGMVQLNTEDPRFQFSEDDLDVLVNVANLVGQVVAHAGLHETQLQFDRRERDMQTANQVQLHFLPQDRPNIPGYELFDYYHAADGVGGDYFGYIELPDGRWGVAMGDVAGKGVSAALLMARLCSDVRYCLVTNPTPAEAVQALNQQISTLVVSGRFITFVLCVLDPAKHEVVVVNAGHMTPLLRRADGSVESVGESEGGPPLGVDANRNYEQTNAKLDLGDTVFLYTDGVSEASNAKRELFGSDRICEQFATHEGCQPIVEAVLAAVSHFAVGTPQDDDTCLVSFSRMQTD